MMFCPVTGNIIAPHRFLPEGTMLEGKYRVGRVLGAGGMGAVFEAVHTMLNKRVAIKVMVPDLSANREMTARMVREARAASATGHRNIATVTDMGWADNGAMYLVMEYLEGKTFKRILDEEGRLSIVRAIRLICQVLSGLEAVHKKGIVHRDLKPDNIMVVDDEDEESVKILDFGISKVLSDDDARMNLTMSGLVMGTPQYMAPEQARGVMDLDHKVDIYAAGAILYLLLTGERPHSGANYNALIACILKGEIPPPSTFFRDIPPGLDRLVLRAMKLNRDERFADAREFRKALEPFAGAQLAGIETAPEVPVGKRSESASFSATDVDEIISLDSLVPLDSATGMAKSGIASAKDSEPDIQDGPVVERGKVKGKNEASSFSKDKLAEVTDRPLEDDSTPLELAEPLVQRVVERTSAAIPRVGTLFEGKSRKNPWPSMRFLFGIFILVTGTAVAWHFRSPMMEIFGETKTKIIGSDDEDTENVMLLIVTEPNGADIYVDGVLQNSNPIELPLSSKTYRLRVQAAGYKSKTLPFQADHTQSLQVNLERR
ncbi:MAG: serine/threonine-protein kinase [Pseudomonadota bacterium]